MLKYALILTVLCILLMPPVTYAAYRTPGVWIATKTTFIEGKLVYKDFDTMIAPGFKGTTKQTRSFFIGSYNDLRDTFLESPETFKVIYNTGILQNYLEYKLMVSNNWDYSKLSMDDFADAADAYIREGNWGILQTVYYSLKGTSRVFWALCILNSSEALYKIGKAGSQSVYYLFRYPIRGIIKGCAAPITFIGGFTWSAVACCITTGWALPFTVSLDALIFTGDVECPGL